MPVTSWVTDLGKAAAKALDQFDNLETSYAKMAEALPKLLEAAQAVRSLKGTTTKGGMAQSKEWLVGPVAIYATLTQMTNVEYDTEVASDDDVETVIGLRGVAQHLEAALVAVHGTCPIPDLVKRCENLRPILSRRDGRTVARMQYEALDHGRAVPHLLVADVARADLPDLPAEPERAPLRRSP